MSTSQKTQSVLRVIQFLERRKAQAGEVSIGDVMQLAEVMADSYKDFFSSFDGVVYQELVSIADEIATMKNELVHLRADDMKHNRIPDAGRELDAIVEATEEATNTIMNAAEELMGADPSDTDAFQALVSDKTIEIFEACSFQDITGQRISKVVSTLNHIDERLDTLMNKLKMPENLPPLEESNSEKRQRELLLNGPQMKGDAIVQDDVDALLADDTVGAQNEIDKLFD
ncbi:MAG: chemotaxis protein [Hyphomicrobiales bacterium]|nr:MAG: chemotaxis protein [Hyphomicrobiales bacterium]